MKFKIPTHTLAGALVGVLSLGLTSVATAQLPGAIFTTDVDGHGVNLNHYADKADVYLDGGPPIGAPVDAAGLPDGVYVFQVTDPSGKILLSTDRAGCRQFEVIDGVIDHVVAYDSCAHATGDDIDQDAKTVQLIPYDDTPNPGGVYKVWVTPVQYFVGKLDEVDAGNANGPDGHRHGFIPAFSKTDNFKVKATEIVECDTRFWDSATGAQLDGLGITWFDTVGASNKKYSEWAPQLLAFHEAHIEAIEPGQHVIDIEDGPGYTINTIYPPNGSVLDGPGAVKVNIPKNIKGSELTVFIDVVVDLD